MAGQPKWIKTPEDLLRIWNEYKEWQDDNPDCIEEVTPKGIVVRRVKKPYLKEAFEIYVYDNYGHHVGQYLDNQDKGYDEYLDVVTCIRKGWTSDQITGTLTGRYKAPNLVARINNITDNRNDETKQYQPLFPDELPKDNGNK